MTSSDKLRSVDLSAALISSRFVDGIALSFRVRRGDWCGERKQTRVLSWRTEEGKEIDEDLGGELEGAGGMIHGLRWATGAIYNPALTHLDAGVE